MQKTTLFSVAAVLVLVACATAPDEGTSASAAAETTNAPATSGRGTGRTTNRTGTNKVVTTNGQASDGGAAPTGCYANQGTCEPTNPAACGKGESCDINGGSGLFECFPPPNDSLLGDACDNGQGPFCAHGLACDNGTCKTYCCDDSACAAGTTCTETGTVGEIVIKVCL